MGDRARDGLAGWWVELPPAAGTTVMATGIVSIGLHLVGQEALSRILLVLAAFAWLALAVDFARRLMRDRNRWETEADTPPALNAVAATTILGTWFALLGRLIVAVAALVRHTTPSGHTSGHEARGTRSAPLIPVGCPRHRSWGHRPCCPARQAASVSLGAARLYSRVVGCGLWWTLCDGFAGVCVSSPYCAATRPRPNRSPSRTVVMSRVRHGCLVTNSHVVTSHVATARWR
ncbi:hypothetical protein [Streptomyces sp. NBC_01618]|uniref:SLAC1 family transporter n=1 Tax=Streptomyces sp. NBC_01618 TaxID=2975900 RepID=UPI00386D2AA0